MTIPIQPSQLERFFSPKKFSESFGWGVRRFTAEVESPDLRGLQQAISGDWGATYRVELPLEASFLIRYRCAETGQTALYCVSPPSVRVAAPMRASERKAFPFALSFIDAARGLRFRALMSTSGDIAHVDIERIDVAFDVCNLLFREDALRSGDASVAARQTA